jgi:nucleoside-triphosphatase THEP1
MAAALLWLCAAAFIGSQWLPGILWSTLALGLWLAVLHVTRPDVTRRMWKPRFWGFTFVVALLAGFFLGAKDLELGWLRLSTTGLVSGVEMLLRAAFVMSVALLANAALSSGRFEKARRFLGPARLWESVQTATALLPDLMESLGGRFWRGGRLLTLLRQARGLAEGSAVRPHTPLAIGLYGSPGTGKTTFLTTLAQMLTEAQMSVGGIVQPAVEPGEALLDAPTPRFRSGQAAGAYDLLDLATGERRRLATKRASRDGCTQTGCDFDHAAWSWAAARLAEAARTCDVVILDELGRLEAGGMGHLPGLLAAMAGSQCRYWILGIRLQALEAMVLAFPHPLVPLSVERTDLSALVRGLRLGA